MSEHRDRTPAAPSPETPGRHSVPREGAPRGAALLRAVEVMEALRAPDGDAWSHTQTHASLARYLLEETHEVLEVIDDPAAHGPVALRDELGDLLFQILFHARIGQEEEPAWDVDDVARSFVAKMERRNPHVFGAGREDALEDPADVEAIIAQWHAVKAQEKAAASRDADGTTDGTDPRRAWSEGIPAALPALQRGAKMVHRARSAGALDALLAAADAEVAAGSSDPGEPGTAAEDDELARALLDLVVAAEERDTDPETALRSLLARADARVARARGTHADGTA
ncbi:MULTISPECIES: MazG nucleotide pyrophosphohydrolase domain-containing protein [Brachybacterium]|uniref:MazG nucleotide pyrophosphohydrolase domain-containing protein n=1 Tax=Brachybacterium rhamnosum TaxID=173361 RepID=A0ABW4PTC1_9MICO|nr:MazG nucleotide pyrophosphohydrolase domain-containing protein [Brachybacterium squillarum]MCW1803967.1 tetrapyrrole methyltransferase [Brachybacterium squillarum]